jgi:hypothetical protein
MRTLGDHLQAHTWNKVVETMIERSGGDAPDGVQHDEAILEEVEGKEVERWLEGVALRRARVDTAEQIDSLANDAR